MTASPSRRQVTAGFAGFAGLAACAPIAPPHAQVLVNLTSLQPAAGEGDTAQVASGADLALRMTVPVRVNGAGPFQFVVDTGANHSVVATELAQELGLPERGRAQVHGIAGGEPAQTVIVSRLDVGAVAARRVKAPLLARARLGAEGLLGVDVLKNRRVTMDFVRNELRIAPSESRVLELDLKASSSRLGAGAVPDPAVVRVPARYRFGQLIIVDAQVGAHPVTAFLDSGSQNTVGNLALERAVTGDPGFVAQKVVVQLMSATGQTASGRLSPIPPLRLGGLRIGNMSAVFADLHVFDIWDLTATPAILIGIDVMRHFGSIELDFGKKMVTFRTPQKAAPAPPGPPG